MGFWQCKDGTMVEMIFDEEGKFSKFGDDVTSENAEKAKTEIMESEAEQRSHSKLIDMIENGVPFEEIADKFGADSCVSAFKLEVPNWCHEDADCHNCWVECLNKYFGD